MRALELLQVTLDFVEGEVWPSDNLVFVKVNRVSRAETRLGTGWKWERERKLSSGRETCAPRTHFFPIVGWGFSDVTGLTPEQRCALRL